jgi:PAS domain S-box-containing protein
LWLQSQFSPVVNEKGSVSKILYLGNDITLQKEIEERNSKLLNETLEKNSLLTKQEKDLKQQNEQLFSIQSELSKKETEIALLNNSVNSSLLKAEYDPRGNVVTVNNKFLEVFQFMKNEIFAKNIRDFIPREDLLEFETLWSNLHLGIPFSGIVKRIDKTGDYVWLYAAYTPQEDTDGVVQKVTLIAADLTQQTIEQSKNEEAEDELKNKVKILQSRLSELEIQNIKYQQQSENYKTNEENLAKKFENTAEKKYYIWIQKIKSTNQ